MSGFGGAVSAASVQRDVLMWTQSQEVTQSLSTASRCPERCLNTSVSTGQLLNSRLSQEKDSFVLFRPK